MKCKNTDTIEQLLAETPLEPDKKQVEAITERILRNLPAELPEMRSHAKPRFIALKYAAAVAIAAGVLWVCSNMPVRQPAQPEPAPGLLASFTDYFSPSAFSPDDLLENEIEQIKDNAFDAVSFIAGCVPVGILEIPQQPDTDAAPVS